MDADPVPTKHNANKPYRLPLVLLCFGFVCVCMGILSFAMNNLLLSYSILLLGGSGIIYGSIKIPAFGFFLLTFTGWIFLGLYINDFIGSLDFFDSPYLNRHYAKVIPAMLAVQLMGLGFAYFLYRKNKRSASLGIILASIPYLLGFVLFGGCVGPGLPFPLSFIPC
ncbi:MAG: hypothetical protein K8S20_09795 [Chloroflexi bacterium]|nr:hypothetical protein [Chloroflexota bacterium]